MTHGPASSTGRDSGFTLLELIVVLAIVALAATLALPSAQRTRSGLTVRQVTVDLAAALKTARAEAIRSNQDRQLVVDLAARRFTADGVSRPHALPRGIKVAYELPAGEQLGEGRAAIRFRPDGSSTGGTLRVSAPGHAASVRVDWLTGRTSVAWGR